MAINIDKHASLVQAERERQVAKWGLQIHPDNSILNTLDNSPESQAESALDGYGHTANSFKSINDEIVADGTMGWDTILLEEVYEALAESDIDKLRTELVQSAAVIFAWLEDLDRRESE